jgi:hypothetical protein
MVSSGTGSWVNADAGLTQELSIGFTIWLL